MCEKQEISFSFFFLLLSYTYNKSLNCNPHYIIELIGKDWVFTVRNHFKKEK